MLGTLIGKSKMLFEKSMVAIVTYATSGFFLLFSRNDVAPSVENSRLVTTNSIPAFVRELVNCIEYNPNKFHLESKIGHRMFSYARMSVVIVQSLRYVTAKPVVDGLRKILNVINTVQVDAARELNAC